jgi:4,5-dihydroxyphthalate decarboxylase
MNGEMSNVHVHMVIRNYDQITPILAGDVVPEGIELTLDRTTPIANFLDDNSFQAGETSFSGYLRSLAAGDRSIVGLPIFVTRGFRHRCFFVRRDSGISSLGELEGKRIGTNGWPDTGNTWSRALLRAEGVNLDDIEWHIGTIDGVIDQAFGHRVSAPSDRGNVHMVPEDRTLQDMLLADELDALMIPWPPQRFHEPDSPVVRLFSEYRRVEQEYARNAGFWPAHHLIGVRADFVDRYPEAVKSLYAALDQSRRMMEERRWALADTTPWLLTELEETTSILGVSWQAYGVEPNRRMVRALCEELRAQHIIDEAIVPETVFADFESLFE